MVLAPFSSEHRHNRYIHDASLPEAVTAGLYTFSQTSDKFSANTSRDGDLLVPAEPSTVNQHPTEFLPSLTKRFDSDSVIINIAVDRLFNLYVDAWRPWDSSSEARDDRFERDFAVRWLSAVACRLSEAAEDRHEALLNKVTSLLAICSGSSGSGEIVRTLAFQLTQNETMRVRIREGSINSHDHPGAVGMQTWGSAPVLGRAIALDPNYFLPDTAAGDRALRVLELGAGTGVVSLVAAKSFTDSASRAVDIIATDYDTVVLRNLGENIMRNGPFSGQVNIRAHHLDWQYFVTSRCELHNHEGQPIPGLDAAFGQPFDVIFGADVVYEQHQALWLKATVEALLRRPSSSSSSSPSSPQPRFHLVVQLRPTHAEECASITAAFPLALSAPQRGNVSHSAQNLSSSSDAGHAHLAILYMEEVGFVEENMSQSAVRYMRYEIGWASSLLDS